MLDPSLLRFLEKHGLVADGVRALRPDGPMDRTGFNSRCIACGNKFSGSVMKFYLQDGKCSCGGTIDDAPLTAFVKWALTPGSTKAELPANTFFIDTDANQQS